MALAKGTNILNVKTFVVARFGEDAWTAVVARASPEDRACLDGLLPVGWYDLALLLRFYDALEAALGTSEPQLIQHFGTFAAEHDLTRIHRLFLRMANPAYVIEKSGDYWHRFFDTGSWHVVRETPTNAIATLGAFVADERFCRMLTAYIRRMFELVGAKAVKVEHTSCRALGDKACVFVGSWKA